MQSHNPTKLNILTIIFPLLKYTYFLVSFMVFFIFILNMKKINITKTVIRTIIVVS